MKNLITGKIKIALTAIVLTAIAVGGVAFRESKAKAKRINIWCNGGPGAVNDQWNNWVIAAPDYFKGYCDAVKGTNVQARVSIRPL
jgi:hypothetical protein